jgi:hypothetical protein
MFEGPQALSDESCLKQLGPVLSGGDLAPHGELFERLSHRNPRWRDECERQARGCDPGLGF